MAVFELKTPSGQTYEVEAPDEQLAVEALAQMEGENAPEWSDLPGNIGPSARKFGSDLLYQLNPMNYPEQLRNMSSLASGAIENIPGVTAINDWAEQTGIAPPRDREAVAQNQDMASGAWDYLKGRYGGLEELKRTAIEDPVGSLADAASLAGGGAALAGKGPMVASRVAMQGTKLPRATERMLTRSIPDDLTKFNAMGNEAMLLDAGPSTVGLAQGVAATPGPGREAITAALLAREGERSNRLVNDTTRTLGRISDPEQVKASIEATAKAQAAPLYKSAKANAQPITAAESDAILNSLADSAAGMSKGEREVFGRVLTEIEDAFKQSPDPTVVAERLHNVRMGLDAQIVHDKMAFNALNSADKAAQAPLKAARSEIDHLLKTRFAGFRQADQIRSTAKKAQEDIDYGFGSLGGGTSADFPQTFIAELQKRGRPYVAEGMRSYVGNAMGTKANDLAALKRVIGDGNDFNRKKLEATFGKQAVDELVKAVEREGQFSQNFSDITRNSQTAQRLIGEKLAAGPDAPKIDQSASMTGLGLRTLNIGLNKLLARGTAKYSGKNAEALAKALALKGVDARKLAADLANAKSTGQWRRTLLKALLAQQAGQEINAMAR